MAQSGRKWTVVFHTKLDRTRIEPADFDAFIDFQERVSAGHRAFLTMKPSETVDDLRADIQLVEKSFEKEPKNLPLALELAQLNLRAGHKEKAAKVLRAARLIHPGNQRLLELLAQAMAEAQGDRVDLSRVDQAVPG